MAWYLWLYLALLAAVPLYSAFGSMLEEETPDLSDVFIYLIHAAVLLCFAAYVRPDVAASFGGWLWPMIVIGGAASLVLAYGTWGAIVGGERTDLEHAPAAPEAAVVDSPLVGRTLDLDAGNPPMTEEEQAEVGQAIMTMFSPVASTGDRFEGLAKLGKAMPDNEEDEEGSRADNLQVFAFSVLSIPAVVLGALAALR